MPQEEKANKRLAVFGLFVVGAFLLRLLFARSRIVLVGDEYHYAESLFYFMRWHVIEGFSDYWSFLFPFSAMPFGWLTGSVEWGLRLVAIVSGSIILVPAMMIALKLWGSRSAIYAGALLALHPNLVSQSTAAMTEIPYALFLMLSLWIFVRYLSMPRSWHLPLLGISLALAWLMRQEAQFILVLFLLFVMLGRGGRGLQLPVAKRALLCIPIGLFFLITVSPYIYLLHAKTGRWTGGSKAAVNLASPVVTIPGLERERFVYSLNEEGTGRRIDDMRAESTLRVLWSQKENLLANYFPKLNQAVGLLPTLLSSPFLLVLLPLGLFGRRWAINDRGIEFLLVLVGVFPFLLISLFKVQARYFIPYLPIYLLWVARGCEVLVNWFEENVSRRSIVNFLVLAVIFASLLPYGVRRYILVWRSQPREVRTIAEWIRESEGETTRVLAHSGCSVNYYIGTPEATYIPWTDVDGLHRFATYHKFDYLLVDESYFLERRPTLRELLDEAPDQGFDLVKTFNTKSASHVWLYRVLARR